jgi:hypothetical protein
VQDVEVVLDRLRGVTVGELPSQIGGDVVGVDAIDPPLPEERLEVAVEVAEVVVDRGSLPLITVSR